jgi:aryl-alcohol dehydrogenase-like predicted oxidoreductase
MQSAAEQNGWTTFVSMQDQYNLVQREEEREMHGLLADQGIGNTAWSPLGGGIDARPGMTSPAPGRRPPPLRISLAGRCSSTPTKRSTTPVERIAAERGVAMATVALAWALKNPVVDTPIIGATKEKHLTDAAAALELTLSEEEVSALEAPCTPREPTFF